MENYSITRNEHFNSLEVTFETKPAAEIIAALKGLRFRWHGVKRCWYGYATEEQLAAALKAPEAAKPAKPEANRYGVQVGDLFSASWGYDQTNVDFFQVIALVGTASVRVRQVNPPMIDEAPTGPMAANRTYKITRKLLPAAPCSVFIKDQERGDLKRLTSYAADGISNPQFRISSFANAHYCTCDTMTAYESWYA